MPSEHPADKAPWPGYRAQFVADAVRHIQRQGYRGPDAVDAAMVDCLARARRRLDGDITHVQLAIYEAAVLVSFSAMGASEGLDLLLEPRAGLAARAHSRALLFATAAERLDELRGWLATWRKHQPNPESLFNNHLACAQLALIAQNPLVVRDHADQAAALAMRPEEKERAERLSRAAGWLMMVPNGPEISQWRLRGLHHLLPREVAERLEEGNLSALDGVAASPVLQEALDTARTLLADAARLVEDHTGRQPLARQALSSWALEVGLCLLEADDAGPDVAIPYTAAAWLLAPDGVPDQVLEAHARAVARACAALPETEVAIHARQVLDKMLASHGEAATRFVDATVEAWREAPRPATDGNDHPEGRLLDHLERASERQLPRPAISTHLKDIETLLAGIDKDAEREIVRCLIDRYQLLPDEAPFRGRRWFGDAVTHSHYQKGRKAATHAIAHQEFEQAWAREPNNNAAFQGLILGLRHRVSLKPGRDHLLQYVARFLDQIADHEVEAALAYVSLAKLAARADRRRERLDFLRRAVAALRRRLGRQPWRKARNAEIALLLEAGELVEAGEAAWAEAELHLPGSPNSRRYAILAATLWERSRAVDQPRIDLARSRINSPFSTTREAVRKAAETGRLGVLNEHDLDDDALEDLWWAWRGNEDDLRGYLERQATSDVDPRPRYREFLRRKDEAQGPSAPGPSSSQRARAHRRAQRSEERGPRPFDAPPPRRDAGEQPGPTSTARVRWAIAEVLPRDPLRELALPAFRLAEIHVRELIVALRECAGRDPAAVEEFVAAVEDALDILHELEALPPTSSPELRGSRLARALDAVNKVGRTVQRVPAPMAEAARLLWKHLESSLGRPVVEAYRSEKDKRLVRSTLGERLSRWWTEVCSIDPTLDFFHFYQAYRCPDDMDPMCWWKEHEVNGRPVQEAVRTLAEALATHRRQLTEINEQYLARPGGRPPGLPGFGLLASLDKCCGVLRSALSPNAGPAEVRAIAGALQGLGMSLRRIDVGQRVDGLDLLVDPDLPRDTYLLPGASELLGHWEQNVRDESWFRAVVEVSDETGHEVACLLGLDAGDRPVPETVRLHGMAPFVELVEALGGRYHLWVARQSDQTGCRLDHSDVDQPDLDCGAEKYVARIVDRLRHLAEEHWPMQREAVIGWCQVLEAGLRSRGNAALSFAVLPRLRV